MFKFYLIQDRNNYREKLFVQKDNATGEELSLFRIDFGEHKALTEEVTEKLTASLTGWIADELVAHTLKEKDHSKMAEARDTTKTILKKLFSHESP